MYTGYELTKESRERLREAFPPKYPEMLGHHITEEFGVKDPQKIPEQPGEIKVIGYVDEGNGLEGLLVSIDGNTRRPDGSLYHITWSIDRSKGYKPFHTNKYIKNAVPLTSPININASPKFFTGSTTQELKKQTLKDYFTLDNKFPSF